MADTLSAEKRSWNMSRIRGKDTAIEKRIRSLLFRKGFRFRKNDPRYPGKPDIVLPKYHTAIFVHGCFWHRHSGCKYAYTPKSKVEFWSDKFDKNIKRDNVVRNELEEQGVRQIIIWECTVNRMMKNAVEESSVIGTIQEFLESDRTFLEL